VVGASQIARLLGSPDVIATDVGGTTFKWGSSGTASGGQPRTVLNQYQLRLPMVDLASIGAGGGSSPGGRLAAAHRAAKRQR